MKERKYQELYTLRTQLDPNTGKEKRIPVYQGDYYELPDAFREKKTYLPCWLSVGMLCFAAWLAYLFAGSPSTFCMYVLPPAACAVFPFCYLLMGLLAALRAPIRMNVVEKEKGIGRVYHSFWGLLWIFALTLIADMVFICINACFRNELPGLLLLAAMLVLSVLGIVFSRGVYTRLNRIEVKES